MSMWNKWRERALVALCASLVLIILLDGARLQTVSAKEKSDLLSELKIFTDVLSIVQRDYVESVDEKKLVEGAIKGMLSTLDPHSGYLSPEFYNELQVETSGEFGGLGIEITLKDNLLLVVSPIEGSPAEAAGIQPGDAIIKIDGKFTKDLSLVDAVQQMRGPKGTPITISVYRKGFSELKNVTITRDVIKVKSVKGRYLKDGFGLVRVSQFQENTATELKDALKRMKAQSPSSELAGLVLDFRNNPGGLLNQAIMVSDLFLNEGLIVYTDGRVEGQKKKFFAQGRNTEPNYPIVVLVNGGSASASEIVAGALKDHGRGLILGTKTFGKGSVQTILPLDNSGALRLTTALYYTKSGRSIQATGIEPDIVMEEKLAEEVDESLSTKPGEKKSKDNARTIRESDLPGAISNPSGLKEEEQRRLEEEKATLQKAARLKNIETADLGELLESDTQLERAFDLLKSYNIFQKDRPGAITDLAKAKSQAS